MNKFTVITPTGDRPESFKICVELMSRQTEKPTEWIIIDDGNQSQISPNFNFVRYIRRNRKKEEPPNSLPVQMQKAIGLVTTDKVIIVEDDDWYDCEYLKMTSILLEAFDLVGHTHNVYYFVKEQRYFIHQNIYHSSFCSTAFTRKVFPYFDHVKMNNPYVDLGLWRTWQCNKKCLYRPKKTMVLGMKQMPGRPGPTYDSNRSILSKGMKNDFDSKFLKSVIGNDFPLYLPYLGNGNL
jgi:glycosyltransferase involved in cell wall biosynthesis